MTTSHKNFDIAIVGSGFAGSLMAMIARRLGRSVLLIEKSRHPRFVIGESSTPLANLLLEELASKYDLPRLLPLTKWGSWQRAYPEIAVGLKRGFTFYHHQFGSPYVPTRERTNELLVAASPHSGISDTHWYRPDFDHFLVRETERIGVQYLDETTLKEVSLETESIKLEGERHGETLSVSCRFLVDATGPRGFLHRALQLDEAPLGNLPATQGLFTHFTGVRRLEELPEFETDEKLPYPIDDAAVHHIFDGGWIWVLRFNNGITSAGVAAVEGLAQELKFEEGEPAWQRLLKRLPTVASQFKDATSSLPFIHAPRLPFRSSTITGPNWAMLPYAAGFIDPLLSTGFPLALLGIGRLARAIESDWETRSFHASLETYAEATEADLLAAERLVAALYSRMNDFELFTSISRLYFAAASFTEAARRLGRPQLAGSFLLHDHSFFGPRSRYCVAQALRPLSHHERSNLTELILQTIAPVDVAGLSDASRRNWYPVLAKDLVKAAPKLEATEGELEQLLIRSGFIDSQSG